MRGLSAAPIRPMRRPMLRIRPFFGLSAALRFPIRPHAHAFSLRSIRHAALPRFVSAIHSRTCAAKAHKVGDVLLRVSD